MIPLSYLAIQTSHIDHLSQILMAVTIWEWWNRTDELCGKGKDSQKQFIHTFLSEGIPLFFWLAPNVMGLGGSDATMARFAHINSFLARTDCTPTWTNAGTAHCTCMVGCRYDNCKQDKNYKNCEESTHTHYPGNDYSISFLKWFWIFPLIACWPSTSVLRQRSQAVSSHQSLFLQTSN